MIKYLLFLFIFFLIGKNVQSQSTTNTFQDKLYLFFISNNMKSWQNAVDLKKDAYKQSNENELFDLVNAYYGLIGYYLEIDDEDLAEQNLKFANIIIESLIQIAPTNMRYRAFESAFITFEMELSMWKVMSLGPKSQKILTEAKKKAH